MIRKIKPLLIALCAVLLSNPASAMQSWSLGSAVTTTGAQTAIQLSRRSPERPAAPLTAFVLGAVSSSTGSATIDIEVSNDGSTYITACTITLSLTTTTSADGCGIAIPWIYVRMNVTAISGTGAAVSGILAAAT